MVINGYEAMNVYQWVTHNLGLKIDFLRAFWGPTTTKKGNPEYWVLYQEKLEVQLVQLTEPQMLPYI
jgi:hypothetical protein